MILNPYESKHELLGLVKRAASRKPKRNATRTPLHVEQQYDNEFQLLLARVATDVNAQLMPVLEDISGDELIYASGVYASGTMVQTNVLRRSFANLYLKWNPVSINSYATNLARHSLEQAVIASDKLWRSRISTYTGLKAESVAINPIDYIESSTVVNARLIEQTITHYLNRCENIVFAETMQSQVERFIKRELTHQLGIASRKGTNIVYDQIGKLDGALNKMRQKAMGITHYRWDTMQDWKVRCSHRDAQSQIFRWDTIPTLTGGHPGEPINCRCWATPILTGLFTPVVENAIR